MVGRSLGDETFPFASDRRGSEYILNRRKARMLQVSGFLSFFKHAVLLRNVGGWTDVKICVESVYFQELNYQMLLSILCMEMRTRDVT
jgi:hypothetical protein